MGSDELLAQQEQGWSFSDKYVCGSCVEDEHLRQAVQDALDSDYVCDFCEASPAAPLDALLEPFFEGIRTEYATADDEGAYFERELATSRHWDGWEVVDQFADYLGGDELQQAVRDAANIDIVWVERDFVAPRYDEALRDGWNALRTQVMHHTRFVFWLVAPRMDADAHPTEVTAGQILDVIGSTLPQVGIVRELPAGHRLWRARAHATREVAWGPADLGTATPDKAKQPNRMSPAGIPLFYGADDPDTAVREIAGHAESDRNWVTYAQFETSRPCRIVDFTRLPDVPSPFDVQRRHLRRSLIFLHDFVQSLSADHDGQEHLEYVPTQVVTEYLLRAYQPEEPVVGLAFFSAARGVAKGTVCTVLDVANSRCVASTGSSEGSGELQLVLVPGTLNTAALPSRRV